MMRSEAVAAALAVAVIVSNAAAETKPLMRAGIWEAFGGTTVKGRAVCGVSAEPAGRYFGLKLYAGLGGFTIQMGTKEWQLENGRKIPLTLRFDARPIWHATGAAFHFDDGDAGLQFDVNRSEIDNFAREFRDSGTLLIQFENDVLPQWVVGLEGTTAVSGAFQTCVRSLK